MRFFFRGKRKLALLVAVPLVLVAVAVAAWMFTQSTNQFQARTGSTPTLTLRAPTAADFASVTYQPCVPGGSCDLLGEIDNPANTPVKLLSWQPSQGSDYGGGGTCNATNFSGPLEGTSLVTLATPITIPANASSYVVDIPNALSLNSNAPTACQSMIVQSQSGAPVTFNFAVGS